MPTVETKIWMALKARVQTLPAPVNYPVDWPMETFQKPEAGGRPSPYIECRHLLNEVQRPYIDSEGSDQRPSILQLSLMWPVALVGTGSGQQHPDVLIQMAGLVAAHFPADESLRFQDIIVKVERAPSIAQPFRDEAYWRVPISVRVQYYP